MKGFRKALVWAFLALALAFLYAPMIPPAILSFRSTGGDIFVHYGRAFGDPVLRQAIVNSLIVAFAVGIIAPLLALFAAEAVRVWSVPRLIIGLILIPLFVPGISMGLGTALLFRELGIPPSILTIIAVQTLWALPFAFLIILTVQSSFDQVYLEAAYLSGANRLQAFFDIELPQIRHGLIGAATFSMIISLNETIRTALVQGANNTVQTFIWSRFQQVGLDRSLHALMTVLIVGTLLLVVLLAVFERRAANRRT